MNNGGEALQDWALANNAFASDVDAKNIADQLSIFDPENKKTFPLRASTVTPRSVDAIQVFEDVGLKHQKLTESKKLYGTNLRKHNGVYYTPYQVAYRVISDVLSKNPPSLSKTFLEPCAGSGIFVIAYIDYVIKTLKLDDEKSVQRLIENIYCAEIDPLAMGILKSGVQKYVADKYDFVIELKDENLFVGNALYDYQNGKILKTNLNDVFHESSGFDYIFTNPPYKLLKANSDKYGTEDGIAHKQELKDVISFLKKGGYYPLSQGALNLYKLFVEDIATRYLKSEGGVGLLIPQTILNDKQSSDLRRYILDEFEMTKVYIIPEGATFFDDITQAFCLFGFNHKTERNSKFEVLANVKDEQAFVKSGYVTTASTLSEISIFEPIIITDKLGYDLLRKIHVHPALRENKEIKNLRGELDLTLNKEAIIKDSTEFKLLRGAHITEFHVKESSEYVEPAFLQKSAKSKYAESERLACQQISNMKAAHRLKFALVPANYVLANSVNFIFVESSSSYTTKSLLAILNSTLLDWRFKLTSSNNHINNYELGDLPLPADISDSYVRKLESCIDKLDITAKADVISEIDEIVAQIYSISSAENEYIHERTN